ncbi:copper amine oxidase N-terminal domain-containing protein [Paenibacillus psychroresistens]|uniref:Copper amine oxidase N-terminal domain-containing protein n=1 Tax=Paenibacillus psychroresistens TaxID=1778678 RepID=A0A6B8RV53_9BACL|nr:copper amine oxidase N-terminal domain-containing protein [Paenibacillus psychroresistens]QGQ99817.1 copper amine oxidase N-terminal domain-containing protein [Paenibacillus psychroresistens]
MRKLVHIIAFFALLLGCIGLKSGIVAAEGKAQIVDLIGKNTLLMNDGTMWSMFYGTDSIQMTGNIASISGNEVDGIGTTRSGDLVSWVLGELKIIEGQTGVKQVAYPYWLKTDGTVVSTNPRMDKLQGIAWIASDQDKSFAYLKQNGELKVKSYNLETTLGIISDVSSIKAMEVHLGRVAVLFNSGAVVIYSDSNFDDKGRIVPSKITEDAVDIALTPDAGDLLIARKDGSVWTTGHSNGQFKLDNQLPGLDQVIQLALVKSIDQFYAKKNDGSWESYSAGDLTPFDAPIVKSLSLTTSDVNPLVGDTVHIGISATYSNNGKINVPASVDNVTVDKPNLLKLLPNGAFKVIGVGQTQVTATTGGVSKSVTISSSSRSNLKYAKKVKDVVFVQVKPIVQALGGTVATKDGGVDIVVGNTKLTLKAGSLNALLNGENKVLKSAPLADKTDIYMPASILTDVFGAKVLWNDKLKQADISFGTAHMTIVSAETAALVKKAGQGTLIKYIGKSYWINYYQQWDRFSKVTVTDIQPDNSGSFTVIFKSAAGKKVSSESMTAFNVTELFEDGASLLKYDPYKKYAWSTATWKLVKAEEVAIGMNKDQVTMSWGVPYNKSVLSSNGKTIEIWYYTSEETVGFVNGIVKYTIT